MKSVAIITPIIFTFLLTACGGGSSGVSYPKGVDPLATGPLGTTPAIATQETINGIPVPPDPGAAKDATVLGVDTDHNGIRDEIDRWIATKYGNKPGALQAIRMVAKVDQDLLAANPTSKEQALAATYPMFDVGCTGYKLEQEGIKPSQVFNELMIRTFNTRDRIDVYKRADQLAGMIVRSVDESTVDCSVLK